MDCTVSIIIPSYNRAHILPTTIPTYVQEYVKEIIIVDDLSTDKTHEVVKKIMQEFPIVRYIRASSKVLQTGAKNIGIKNAVGDYCYFGDDDSILKPGTIKSLLNVCRYNSKSIVGARHLYLKNDDDIEEKLRDEAKYPFVNIESIIDRQHIKLDTYKKYDRVLEVPFCQSCFMLPTNVAKKQLFFEGYVGTCNREETDYQLQVCLNFGFNILLDNESLSLDLPRAISSGGIRSIKAYKRHFLEIYNEYIFWKRNRKYLVAITGVNSSPIVRALCMLLNKVAKI